MVPVNYTESSACFVLLIDNKFNDMERFIAKKGGGGGGLLSATVTESSNFTNRIF